MQQLYSDKNSQKKSIFAIMKAQLSIKHSLAIFIHIIAWAIVLLMPIFIDWGNESINWVQYLKHLPVPLCFLAVFYIKMMPTGKFIRVHRSFIVQKSKIRIIEQNRIVFGKTYIPIGDNYKKEFQEFLNARSL